ncbi:AraC family transcriptional regulator ligand-binding domain-containing protein [Candidatus Aalborgicola defluviihabitans]|uniref:AraC family transcriptional regulator n=1 Tax=Candidatus Aalborgicola defluviihabitans TaxID=3386187 RepID=UPI00390BA3D6|nr:AraC family transcriptional regulator ligand-binding domain-containing protein [Burkholderiales bacterium]
MPTRSPASVKPTAGRVAGAYVKPPAELAVERGVALPALALAAGLPETPLSPVPESLAAADYVRLLDAGAQLAQHPHFGLHVGERVKLGTYSVYGLILLSCRDLGQVFQQTLRYESLAHDLGRSALQVQGSIAEYQWHSHFPQASRHLAESVFAGVRVFGNWLAGSPLPPAAVSFTHSAPTDTSEYRRIFGTDVTFGASLNGARFNAALLALPVPNADVGLYPVLRQHAEQLLQAKLRLQDNASITTLVRASLSRHLAQDRANLASVAQDLNLTQRTLQRKLSATGTSFQQVRDQTRQELALSYLGQRDLSLTDIAFLLGYQDQSAFTHAFKEWTGGTPGGYRDKLGKP